MGNCLHGLSRLQVDSVPNDYMCNDTALKDGNSKTKKVFENEAFEKQKDNKFEIADVEPLNVDVSKFETSDDLQNVYRPETDYKYSSLIKDSPKPSIDQQSYPSHENSASLGTIDAKNKQIVSKDITMEKCTMIFYNFEHIDRCKNQSLFT